MACSCQAILLNEDVMMKFPCQQSVREVWEPLDHSPPTPLVSRPT